MNPNELESQGLSSGAERERARRDRVREIVASSTNALRLIGGTESCSACLAKKRSAEARVRKGTFLLRASLLVQRSQTNHARRKIPRVQSLFLRYCSTSCCFIAVFWSGFQQPFTSTITFSRVKSVVGASRLDRKSTRLNSS